MNVQRLRTLALLAVASLLPIFAGACGGQVQTNPPAPEVSSGPSTDIYVSDAGNDAVKLIDPHGSITVAAALKDPVGIALNGAILYIVHWDGQKERNVLTKVNTRDGARTEIATGYTEPIDVAADGHGNLYVAGRPQGSGIEKITPDGKITPIGSGFDNPRGVAVDATGNVYVADSGHDAIKKVAVNGAITVVGSGFWDPYGVATDAQGNVYVADTGNDAAKKVAPDGTVTCVYGTLASREQEHVKCAGSNFSFPEYIAVDGHENVYVADTRNNAVYEFGADGGARVIGSGFKSPAGIAI